MKKKLSELKQVDGKLETDFQPTTLSQIWGDRGTTKFGTTDAEEYTKTLADMNLSDLQTHSIGVGIVPSDNREQLTKKLLREFQLHVSAYRVPKISRAKKETSPDLSKAAARILAEGR